MRALLRRHLATVVVAMLTAAITAGAPAIAAAVADFAKDADKVDGRHAVGAGASAGSRAGKLVATNSDGRLPNNIIGKAPNADRLDGLDQASFRRTVLPRGRTMTGVVGGATAGRNEGDVLVHFPMRLAAHLPETKTHIVRVGLHSSQFCPGYGRAAAGHLCVYLRRSNTSFITLHDPSRISGDYCPSSSSPTPCYGANRFGFIMKVQPDIGEGSRWYAYGDWAVTAAR